MLYEFKQFWKRAFDFSGRSIRREYWVPYLLNIAIIYTIFSLAFLLTSVGIANDHSMIFIIPGILLMVLTLIYSIAMFVPFIAVCIRRCHDANMPGWYYLICLLACFLCGIGGIAWIVICALDSKPENQWGQNPKDNLPVEYQSNKSIIFSIIMFLLSAGFYMATIVICNLLTTL